MAGGIAVSGNYSQLTSRDYTRIAYDQYRKYQPFWSVIAKKEKADGAYIREGEMAALGKFPEKLAEAGAIDFQIPKQGNNKIQYFTEFESGFQFSRVMKEDDRQGIIPGKMAKALSDAGNWTIEAEWWDLLNSGFLTTYNVGIDAKALFADDHPNIDAADVGVPTYDNQGTAGALSLSTLQAMLDYGKKAKDHKGRPIVLSNPLLLIPIDLEPKAKELLLSEKKPYVAENTVNVLSQAQSGVQYMVIPYLTSTVAYFMVWIGHDLRMVWRRLYTFEQGDEINTGNTIYKAHMRFAPCFFDPRLAFGNAGA